MLYTYIGPHIHDFSACVCGAAECPAHWHIMRYWSNTDVLVIALPRKHGDIANFFHDILIVSNILTNSGYCVGYSDAKLTQHILTNTGHWPNAATQMTHHFHVSPAFALHWVVVLCFSGMIWCTTLCPKLPNKHRTFMWHLCNVGPTLKSLGRHCIDVVCVFCAHWVYNNSIWGHGNIIMIPHYTVLWHFLAPSTTSHELLSQFSTYSGWRWFNVV